jgi:myosin-1
MKCIEAFGLQGPEAYAYTSMSNCLSVSDIDDTKDFHDTIVSLNIHIQADLFLKWIGL